MKIYLAALLTLFLFTRCVKEELPASGKGNLNQEIEITVNETLELPSINEGKVNTAYVRVHLAEINDSRCPMNANCIRFGSAVVRLWLEQNQEQSDAFNLVIGEALPTDTRKLRNRSADTTLVTVANTQYQVILKSVSPYPCVGCPNQEKPRAGIVVTAK